MSRIWYIANVVWLSVVAAGCDTTENSLRSFMGSECHKQGNAEETRARMDAGGIGSSASRLDTAEDYTRLDCVAWERRDGVLHLAFHNFRSGCGIEWNVGAASVEGNHVSLQAEDPDCRIAACGNCFYDLDFEVAGAPSTGPLDISLVVANESGKPCNGIGDEQVVVPKDESNGARCRTLEPYLFEPPPPPCTRYAPCGADVGCDCATRTQCKPGATNEDAQSLVCVPECSSGVDCPVPDAFDCLAGSCEPKSW